VSSCSAVSHELHTTFNNLYPRQEPAQPSRQIDFKEEPALIPEKEMKKLSPYYKYSGGLADVWECFWSQTSVKGKVTKVSAGNEREFTVPMIFKVKVAVKSIRIPSAEDESLIKQTQRVSTALEVTKRVFSFIGTYRRSVVRLTFGCS